MRLNTSVCACLDPLGGQESQSPTIREAPTILTPLNTPWADVERDLEAISFSWEDADIEAKQPILRIVGPCITNGRRIEAIQPASRIAGSNSVDGRGSCTANINDSRPYVIDGHRTLQLRNSYLLQPVH